MVPSFGGCSWSRCPAVRCPHLVAAVGHGALRCLCFELERMTLLERTSVRFCGRTELHSRRCIKHVTSGRGTLESADGASKCADGASRFVDGMSGSHAPTNFETHRRRLTLDAPPSAHLMLYLYPPDLASLPVEFFDLRERLCRVFLRALQLRTSREQFTKLLAVLVLSCPGRSSASVPLRTQNPVSISLIAHCVGFRMLTAYAISMPPGRHARFIYTGCHLCS